MSLAGAINGEGLSFLYSQQSVMAKCAEELLHCNKSDRMAVRRCQSQMGAAMKPILILAAEAAGKAVRCASFEALIQATTGNVELAALLASSGQLERAVNWALRPEDSMGQSEEYMAGLTLELLVAEVVPEAPVHLHILPSIVRILNEGLLVELDVRHLCIEILAHLSFTHHRCCDLAASFSEPLVNFLLADRGSKGTVHEAVQGKAVLTDAVKSDKQRKSIAAVSGMDFGDNFHDLKSHCQDASFSSGMRQFGEIMRRSTRIGTQTAAQLSSLSNNMDGHLFYVGLLMANLCEMIVPGTNRSFGSFAEPFWSRILFFPGFAICLGTSLEGEPWPPLCDGRHKPLQLVCTYLKLISGGYAGKLSAAVEPLVTAIKACSSVAEGTATDRRVARLSCIALRNLVWESPRAKLDLRNLAEERGGERLQESLEKLASEEPAAGDLLDILAAPAEALQSSAEVDDASSEGSSGSENVDLGDC